MGALIGAVLMKFLLFLVGVLVGGVLVYGVEKLTEDSSLTSTSNSTSEFNAPGTRVDNTLRYVIVVFRHGNKGVTYNYPEDPYPISDIESWPYGPQQLTKKGRVQAYNLGVKLRSLYNGFLPSLFNTTDIYACGDDVERVLQSGLLVLAGLYRPQGWQVWDNNIDWQPIALYTNSPDHSKVIDSCERKVKDTNQMYSLFLEKEALNIATLSDIVYKETAKNLTADELAYLFQKLSCEEAEGFALPEWSKSVYPDFLYDYYGKWYLANTAATDEVVRLYVGDLLEEMVSTLSSKVSSSLADRKISLYSAHDSTLLTMQVALGVTRTSAVTVINTGSAVIVELHQDSNTGVFSVQTLYVDGSNLSSAPLSLSLSECGLPCDFPKFVVTTNNFTDVNYDLECQSLTSQQRSNNII